MSKYKFNDYTLPGLPEEWNQIAYPNLTIIHGTGTDDPANAFKFWLVCSGEEFTALNVNGANCIAMLPDVVVHQFLYVRGDETWLWQDKGSIIVEDMEALYEENLEYYYFNPSKAEYIWSNKDIKDTSGNVVFAGSEPVLVEADPEEPEEPEEPKVKRDLRSHVLGIALALIQKALSPIKPKQPTAYLYNGVKLPALPEWDRETYPYAILRSGSSHSVVRYFSSFSYDYTWDDGERRVYVNSPHLLYVLEPESDVWSFKGVMENGSGNPLSGITWTNVDLLNEDGTVYLAASEPIPVYE